ncbi:MAG: hypothetical protein KF729_34485 [Sandaracinaceae bacterium]|nr:hypothetical protein [Sandaracinaceae bacterium]
MARVAPLFGSLLLFAACHRPPMAAVPSASRAVTATDITFDGEPPPEDLAETVREHTDALLAPIERCYEDRLASRPALGGEHSLRVYVSAARVIRVTTETSSLDDPALEDCVKQAILRYELPPDAPRGGVFVRFRLAFSPPA